MHGRKKPEKPLSATELSAIEKKCIAYKSLLKILSAKRSANDRSAETLGLLGKVLKSNPDYYSLWNYRREILCELYPSLLTATWTQKYSEANASTIVDGELLVSTDGIKRNPKSYCAWHHRKWIIERFEVDSEAELNLCQEFLKADQRNFHCWIYRRFVAESAGVSLESELAFSLEKLQENFSNYSAFHHRTIYLKRRMLVERSNTGIAPTVAAVADSTSHPSASSSASTILYHGDAVCRPLLDKVFKQELSIIENAIFTEPDDQSAWWYYQFVLNYAGACVRGDYAFSSLNTRELSPPPSATLPQAPSASLSSSSVVAAAEGGVERERHHSSEDRELGQDLCVWYLQMLVDQLNLVKSLLEVEEQCKWGLNMVIVISDLIAAQQKRGDPKGFDSVVSNAARSEMNAERVEILHKLKIIDPIHRNRYSYLQSFNSA